MASTDPIKIDALLLLMQKIKEHINSADKSRRLTAKAQKMVLQKARGLIAEMSKKEERILEKVQARIDAHQEQLHQMLDVLRNVDETLCNVLFAIRQNEYLQAWYPAQGGVEEQKVVGKYVPR